MRLLVLPFLILLFCVSAFAQTNLGEAVTTDDGVTQAALRAAVLGDADQLTTLARLRERFEHDTPGAAKLSENVAALAAATKRPMMTRKEARSILKDFDSDAEVETVMRLLIRQEPRERYYQARADRRYESWRRVFNSMVNAANGVLTLQFFRLLQPPLDLTEYMLVGRKYLTPEQRKELWTARKVAEDPLLEKKPFAPIATAEKLAPRRRALAALQAQENAERAREQNRLEASAWWYEREVMLTGTREPFREEHREVLRELAARQARKNQAVSVVDGDAALREPAHFQAYSELLRAFVLDPAAADLPERIDKFLANYPISAAADDVRAAEAANYSQRGQRSIARISLEHLARKSTGPWVDRATQYASRADFDPEVAFEQAMDAIADRRWEYLLYGEDPSILTASLSPEQARIEEANWIRAARSLFVFDVISRTITLPLLPAFPKDELFEAAETAPEEFYETDAGQDWLARVAKAYASRKRFGQSAEAWDRLGETAKALKMRHKAARTLERQADRTPSARAQSILYKRILDGYPTYGRREKVEKKLEKARDNMSLLATISPKELKAWPELWRGQGLFLDPRLLDGRKGNGEIAKPGVELLTGERMAYRDAATGDRLIVPLEPGAMQRTMQWLYPLRHSTAVLEKLDEPLPRKRIPIGIEGSLLPGFDVAPVLIPLDPDQRERRLYE
ncbi:hypothetical protein KQI84_13405 [bacterium]|nr:hypothetical protein [bacterium]